MFIVTQHYNAMILECVGRGERLEIVTKVHGDVADRIGKPAETGIIGMFLTEGVGIFGTVLTHRRASLVWYSLTGEYRRYDTHLWDGRLSCLPCTILPFAVSIYSYLLVDVLTDSTALTCGIDMCLFYD